jgi:transposase
MSRRHDSELTDEQWNKIEPLLPKVSRATGRRRVDDRRCFEGILWVLRSGARWKDLPAQHPSPSTCWRRLRDWEERDVWLTIWRKFLGELDEQGRLDWEETFAPTAALPRQKKGRLRRKDQTRQGYEVDGGGKRPRCSSGSSTCQCEPARGDADRNRRSSACRRRGDVAGRGRTPRG